MLDKYCEKLAKDWEIPNGFITNISGVYAIPLEEDLEVGLSSIDGGFTLVSTLGAIQASNKEGFYVKLLAGNSLGQFTRGAVIALDEKDNVIVSQEVTFVNQYRDFYETLEDFINTIDTWQNIVKTEA